MENSDSGVCETLNTPNIYLFPSILSLSKSKKLGVLLNLESLFC